jgi:RNA polymerase sigma-70 factor (ECF subfamily)
MAGTEEQKKPAEAAIPHATRVTGPPAVQLAERQEHGRGSETMKNFAEGQPDGTFASCAGRLWEPNHEDPPDDGQMDPDAALVIQAQGGNLEAFNELITRHSRRVYGMIVSIIGDVEEAHDAVQDTFLKVFSHIGDFQRRSKFSTWLMSITSNIALQRLRNRKRLEHFREIGDESELRSFVVRTWEADPEQLYSQAQRRKLVENGLLKLPRKYRVVLVLRDMEQLSTEEAATALGLSVSALKARLFRARRMLRETLLPHLR